MLKEGSCQNIKDGINAFYVVQIRDISDKLKDPSKLYHLKFYLSAVGILFKIFAKLQFIFKISLFLRRREELLHVLPRTEFGFIFLHVQSKDSSVFLKATVILYSAFS